LTYRRIRAFLAVKSKGFRGLPEFTSSWRMHLKKPLVGVSNLSSLMSQIVCIFILWALGTSILQATAVVDNTLSKRAQNDESHHSSVTIDAGPHRFGNLIGNLRYLTADGRDSLPILAQRNGAGLAELQLANPHVTGNLPIDGQRILFPGQQLLPSALRQWVSDQREPSQSAHVSTGLSSTLTDAVVADSGIVLEPARVIVVNLPEFRLYFFNQEKVSTFPVSIGKSGFATPLLKSRIGEMRRDPEWRPPASIVAAALERGEHLAKTYLPGPGNPLGKHAIRLGASNYLIHGTNRPSGLGLRVSHGCVRMYPDDIEYLFGQVDRGDDVILVNEPVKVGWHEGELWMEVHPPLKEFPVSDEELLRSALDMAFLELIEFQSVPGAIREQVQTPHYERAELARQSPVLAATSLRIDDAVIRDAVQLRDGVPVRISTQSY